MVRGEPRTLRRQPVEIRRAGIRIAIRPQHVARVIVGQNEDQVRTFRSLDSLGRRSGQKFTPRKCHATYST